MDKYIGFDIDSKKTIACVVQKGKKDQYATISSDIQSMKRYLRQQRAGGYRLHLTFEISGQAGFIYDSLIDSVDTITVSNPSKMTWIYRTAKKTDRIDARAFEYWRDSSGAHAQQAGEAMEKYDSSSSQDCQ